MRIFVKVAETESFSEAARQLHMSPPAVTRAVAALEDAIGARLLVRTTRSVKMTESGHQYLDDCRRILAQITEAEASAAGSYATPSGTLTITAAALFGHMHVLPVVHEFLRAHPSVNARTLFVDRPVNLVEEGVDVAVRIGNLPDSGYTAIRVGTVRRVVCGAPSYFKAHGTPSVPADLRAHRIAASTGAWVSLEWRFAGDHKVTVQTWLQSNTNEAVIATAIAGMALARVPEYQIASALQDGRLAIVLADHEEPPLPIHVVYPAGRHAPAKVRAFVDLAAKRLSNRD
ncbi:LysR family transcriptional regulator [Pigmentiphaga litoralis]|nr:LysR family transcriptional regulator [Pigmentiphaga litoralis]